MDNSKNIFYAWYKKIGKKIFVCASCIGRLFERVLAQRDVN